MKLFDHSSPPPSLPSFFFSPPPRLPSLPFFWTRIKQIFALNNKPFLPFEFEFSGYLRHDEGYDEGDDKREGQEGGSGKESRWKLEEFTDLRITIDGYIFI